MLELFVVPSHYAILEETVWLTCVNTFLRRSSSVIGGKGATASSGSSEMMREMLVFDVGGIATV
ncbi:hypothetical protein JCM24511_09216 [Saitozyma sp. JCM 24511]|nr:hypothetical protein JCM24511_09216 [Saitozyma sp. JCM 24511]